MPRRVVIVGAGITGAMIAHRLARAGGHDVTLVDAAMRAGRGVSGRSFGWVTQLAGYAAPSPAAFAARAEGRRLYDDLNDRLGGKLLASGDGALVWRGTEAETAALIAERRALGADVVALDRAGIERLAPTLADAPPLAAHGAGDIFLRAGLAANRLAEAAAEDGAHVALGHSVLGLAMDGETVTGVHLAETTLRADAVILATGTAIPDLLPPGATAPEIASSPSALVNLHAEGPAPALAFSGPGLEIRKDRRDEHFIVAAPWRAGNDGTLDDLAAEKCAIAAKWFPGLRNWRVVSAGIGARPMPRTEDGLAAGPVLGVAGLYVAAGHPGVALAPLVAERIAALLDG
ncbi:MAG: NAD(P)/FAD-dependent oxidoreductase [Pseudooceanicola sp.]